MNDKPIKYADDSASVLLDVLAQATDDIQKAYDAGKQVGYLEGRRAQSPPLSDEDIVQVFKDALGFNVKITDKNWISLARALEKRIRGNNE